MSDEILKRDQNRITVLAGVTDDSNQYIRMFRVDPTTKRLKISGIVTSGNGITSINADTTAAQLLAVGTTGTDFAITDNGTGTHTFNLPSASATNRGVVTTGAQTFAGAKTFSTAPILSSLTVSQILALDGSGNVQSLAVATYPSLTELSYVKGVTSAIQTQLNAKGTGNGTVTTVSVATANGFSGSVANATTTPAITIVAGAITPSSVNGLTITSTTGTLTMTNSKTLTVSDSTTLATGAITLGNAKVLTLSDSTTLNTNAITLGGGEVITFSASNALSLLTSGSTSMTFPAVTDTVAVLGTAQTYTATRTSKQDVWSNNAITASGNAATVPITYRLNTVTNNSAATLTITMTTTSAVDGQLTIVRILDSSAVAQTITWVNTENSTVTAPTTSNGSTSLPLTVGFMYNSSTSKWRTIALA